MNFFLRFEQVRIVPHLITEFGLKLVKIGFISGIKFTADIRKIDHITVSKVFVSPVYTRQGLEQVVFSNDATKVELFKAFSVKPCQQHVINKQEVDFAGFKVIHPILTFLLGTNVVQD